ncbi:MAG: uncharacterized protein H6Q30_2264 [Bacteroidetes bacterium]|jgi:hypothetical protein|nr:uncharacterized protein [Bacteroidota bacterium]
MAGPLYRYLAGDHRRLDTLLRTAVAQPDAMDTGPYAEFRKGLLRHIAIEEKIVIPAVSGGAPGKHSDLAARLRLDHGALASLLVPPPSRSIIATIRTILSAHNPLEEGDGGLYELFEEVSGSDPEMLRKLESAPDVPVLPHNERPGVLEATRRAVERAGYELK